MMDEEEYRFGDYPNMTDEEKEEFNKRMKAKIEEEKKRIQKELEEKRKQQEAERLNLLRQQKQTEELKQQWLKYGWTEEHHELYKRIEEIDQKLNNPYLRLEESKEDLQAEREVLMREFLKIPIKLDRVRVIKKVVTTYILPDGKEIPSNATSCYLYDVPCQLVKDKDGKLIKLLRIYKNPVTGWEQIAEHEVEGG